MANAQLTPESSGARLIKLLRYLIFEPDSENYWSKMSVAKQNEVLNLAIQTGTGSLCYYFLRENEIVLDDSRPLNPKFFLASSAMALQRQAQLKTILTLFEHEKIGTIILKGAWSAEFLYPHPALRTMHDIDILLMPKSEKNAYQLIKNNGYTPYAGEYNGPKHLPTLVPINRGLAVELHHDISGRSNRFTAEQLWQYSELIEISGVKTRAFNREMFFLHHCLHMIEEYFGNGIKNIMEAAFIVNQQLFDIAKLLKLADHLGLSSVLALSLAVVQKLFGIGIPAPLDQLPRVPDSIIDKACRLIIDRGDAIDNTSTMLSRECRNRAFLSKIGFLLHRTCLSPVQLAGMYGCSKYSPKLPFYYLHRIMKYATSVPELWLPPAQTETKLRSQEIGRYQHEMLDFCKIDNYHR